MNAVKDNVRTSIIGIVTGVIALLAHFGVAVPAFMSGDGAVSAIATVGVVVIGLFAHDGHKTVVAK